jgi:hypothetical protein
VQSFLLPLPVGRVVNHDELQNAMVRGLHIVRGHFSTYAEDAPLGSS